MGPSDRHRHRHGLLEMRLSCNFVNVYTIAYRVRYTRTCVHARIPNRQPSEDPREETRVSDKSARILVRVRTSLNSMGPIPTPTRTSSPRKSACPAPAEVGTFSLPRAGHARQSSLTCPPTRPTRALFLARILERLSVMDARMHTCKCVLYTISYRVHVYKITR